MTEFDFILFFILEENPEPYVSLLYENGCDDALIGTGGNINSIALAFIREARNREEAIKSAIRDVQNTIPHAKLDESKINEFFINR